MERNRDTLNRGNKMRVLQLILLVMMMKILIMVKVLVLVGLDRPHHVVGHRPRRVPSSSAAGVGDGDALIGGGLGNGDEAAAGGGDGVGNPLRRRGGGGGGGGRGGGGDVLARWEGADVDGEELRRETGELGLRRYGGGGGGCGS